MLGERTRTRAFVDEKRRHQRVKVNLLGRYMLPSRQEYPCQVINMSPGGAAFYAPVQAAPGDRIIAYIDHVGRIEGTVTRLFPGGFAIALHATVRKRDKLAAQLTWLANRHTLNLPEDRRHERIVPRNPLSRITLPDGQSVRVRVVDMSLSGAAISTDIRPPVGTAVRLGKMRARVVRHLEGGLALEFAAVQSHDVLEMNIRIESEAEDE